MSDFLPPVIALLRAEIGDFQAKMGVAQAEMGKVESATAKASALGKGAMLGLAAGMAAVGVESVKMAAGFDQQMELIHTQAGASQAEVDALKTKVLALAPTVGIGPEKLAEGLYHVESAGFRGAAAMDILNASAKTAAIGQSDLEATTQALIGTMAVGFSDVRDAADAGAYLNQIVGIGDMRMDKLAASIATGVLPSFKSAGLGMKDFGAALATLTDNVTPADEAATRLRMTVALLGAPSNVAFKALTSIGLGAAEANKALANRDSLAAYGIKVSQLSEDLRKPDGLLVAVMDLKHHLEASGLTATQQSAVIEKAFGGGRTSGAIMTLLEESDRLKSKYEALGDSTSRAKTQQEAWRAQQQQQFSQQIHQLGAEFQVIGVNIGNFLIPKLQAGAEWLSKHKEAARILAVVVGGVLVAAMGAFTVSLIASAAAAMANPITWIVLAIVAAVALLAVGIYELVKHWSTVWGFIKRIAMDVWHWLVDAWNATWHGIMAAVGWIKSNIIDPIVLYFDTFLVKPIMLYLHVLSAAWQFVWGFLSVIFSDFRALWTAEWHLVEAAAQLAYDRVIKPVADKIDQYVIKPTQMGIHWLSDEWAKAWSWIEDKANLAWLGLKVVWGYIDRDGIHPLHEAVSWLGREWDRIWNGVKATVDRVWSWLKPIFDRIAGAVSDITHGISVIMHDPSAAGKAVAHILGFDQGGWVPGPAGAPQLAVVHGGEFVLSRDMLSLARGGAGAFTSKPTLPAARPAPRQGTPGPDVVSVNLVLDGKVIHQALIPYAQRYKARTGTTGLT